MLLTTALLIPLRALRKAQTMTEYALITAAIAIVAFASYQAMGNDLGPLLNNVSTDLTTNS